MATNTQAGTQQGFGTILSKTGLTNGDTEISQRFVDSRGSLKTIFTVQSTVGGTFFVEKLLRGGSWPKVVATKGTHTASSDEASVYFVDEFPLGVSRLSFEIADAGAGGASTIEVEARSIPR